jgi:hypothetical protein
VESNSVSVTINYPQPAPQITSITTGTSETATINFTQGSNTGSSIITSYQYSIDSGSTWVTTLETSSPIVVTGLTNGSTYSFIIRNNNGLYSVESNSVSVTINYPQPAPQITSITTGISETATINFTQGSNAGSSNITTYQYSTDSGSTWVTALETTSPIVVTGLTNGSTYSFTIRNNNGFYSATSNAVITTILSLPQPAPVITSITTSSQTATINFTQSLTTGVQPITSYQYSTDSGTTWVTALQTTTPIVVTGLTNDATYNFAIRNYNDSYSASSNIVIATILSIPQHAPVITSITTSTNGAATINFTQTTIVASAITSYQYSTNGGTTWVTALQTSGPIVVTGLTNGSTYNFVIRNNNGLYSDNSNTVTVTMSVITTATLIGSGELTKNIVDRIPGISSISFININNSYTSISSNAFSACVGDVNITLPSSITNIGATQIQGDGMTIGRTSGIVQWRSTQTTKLFSNTGSFITANTLFA